MSKIVFCVVALLASASLYSQQSATSAQENQPTYRVTMVPRTILAINYQNRTKTEIGFQGSPLIPLAKGEGDVESRNGRIAVNAKVDNLDPPQKFGAEYLTYVLWAITPEGQANNLGELLLDGKKSKLQATTTLQTFGLIVTAEPYYAVANPSDVVVLENVVVAGTSGTLQHVDVNYMLFKRGIYSYNVNAATQSYSKSNVPLEVEEARNAVEIARNSGAQRYAPNVLSKAEQSLTTAETMLKNGDRRVIVQNSRDAVQNAAAAVQMTMQRRDEEQQAEERAAAARRTATAQAQAQEAAAREQQQTLARQQAELQQRQAELQAQADAQARQRAELQAQQEAQARASAEAKSEQEAQARVAAETKSQQDAQAAAAAQEAASQAQRAAAESEFQQQQLRATLLQQFNRILPTTDTTGGLKANLADVLFATGKFDLQPTAREALAKFSGIVIAHPGLKMQVGGYTDATGSETLNQTLSENRANSVRAYLIAQGIDPNLVTSVGYGKSNPVASNDSASGRQQNRRVEIIISGEIIGTQIGSASAAQQ